MDSTGVDTIRSILLPRAVVLTQAYYVVMWVSETPATATMASNILNSSQQRMAILNLNETSGQYLYRVEANFTKLGDENGTGRPETFLRSEANTIHVVKHCAVPWR
jgi:hypothetical protein